jgi:hypothetical protein
MRHFERAMQQTAVRERGQVLHNIIFSSTLSPLSFVKKSRNTNSAQNMSTSLSLSTPALISLVPELVGFLSSIPSSSTLYLDLEGKNLSRNGTISIITILIHP